MVICATDIALSVLSKTNDVVADGNFKYQPRTFGQFYTVHGFFEGECFPLIFALLPDKNQLSYTRLWNIIKDAIIRRNGNLGHLEKANYHFDFEPAAYNPIQPTFGSGSFLIF